MTIQKLSRTELARQRYTKLCMDVEEIQQMILFWQKDQFHIRMGLKNRLPLVFRMICWYLKYWIFRLKSRLHLLCLGLMRPLLRLHISLLTPSFDNLLEVNQKLSRTELARQRNKALYERCRVLQHDISISIDKLDVSRDRLKELVNGYRSKWYATKLRVSKHLKNLCIFASQRFFYWALQVRISFLIAPYRLLDWWDDRIAYQKNKH